MAFKKIGGQKKYFKYAECEIDEVLVEGEYHREVEGKFGVQYEFLNKDGEVHVLNGSGQLKYLMDFVKEGDIVRISYKGMELLTKGAMAGKEAHQFELERDSDASPDSDESSEDQDGIDEYGDDNLDELPF